MRQVELRVLKRVGWFCRLAITVYKLVRMRRLILIQAMANQGRSVSRCSNSKSLNAGHSTARSARSVAHFAQGEIQFLPLGMKGAPGSAGRVWFSCSGTNAEAQKARASCDMGRRLSSRPPRNELALGKTGTEGLRD
jgi:hypothetical protein